MAVTVGDASYEVRYKPEGVNTDITDKVLSIEKCTDLANGVNQLVILFNSEFGGFVTDPDVDGSATTPLLDEFDTLQVTFTDKNDVSYSKIFEIENPLGSRTGSANLRLEVHALGIEWRLNSMPFAKQFYFENAAFIARDIVDIFNANNGTDADIENHDTFATGENELPRWTANTLPFNISDNMCMDGLKQLMDGLGAPIPALGAGDFFYFKFNDKSGSPGTLEFESGSSGSLPASPLTVTNALVTPVHSLKGENEKKTGNIVGIKGALDFGSLPTEFAKFRSLVEVFDLQPTHIASLEYPSGVSVIGSDGLHYKSNKTTTATPPDSETDWNAILEDDLIGTLQYSPWTEDKAVAGFKNAGGNPDGSGGGFDNPSMWDSNLVILDEDNYQNWCHDKATSVVNINTNYKYPTTTIYRGLRVLVDGNNGAVFGVGSAGNNALLQFNGVAWDIIGPIGTSGVRAPVEGDRIAVRREGFVYEFQSGTWTDVHTDARVNHCFHVYDSIANVQGVTSLDDGLGGNYGQTSGVKITYKYTSFATFGSSVLSVVNFYSIGSWLNFAFPFPESTFGGIGEDVGEIYGGSNATGNEPATLNTDNLIFTPTGLNGFNQVDSNALYPLTSLDFMAKFRWFITATNTDIAFQGNFKFRVYIYDTSDNVVFRDFTIEYMNHFEQINLPLNSFKNYRARVPLSFGDVASNLLAPELEILNQFEWKNVKLITIQLQEVYDDEGRYSPEGSRFVLVPVLFGEVATELTIDSWRFAKQVFELTPVVTSQVQFPPFKDMPQITNTEQAQQLAQAQLDIEQFRYRAFTTDEELLCDIASEDSCYIVDSELIPENDDSSGGIKVVAREINYTVNSPDGAGGIRRAMTCVKRLT
jgi:hypothetical protein